MSGTPLETAHDELLVDATNSVISLLDHAGRSEDAQRLFARSARFVRLLGGSESLKPLDRSAAAAAPPLAADLTGATIAQQANQAVRHYQAARIAWETAGKLVQGDRRTTHGDFKKNFAAIAALWTGFMKARFGDRAPAISPLDVAHMMSIMKTARTMNGAHNPDDHIDAIGYDMIAAGLAADAARDDEDGEV